MSVVDRVEVPQSNLGRAWEVLFGSLWSFWDDLSRLVVSVAVLQCMAWHLVVQVLLCNVGGMLGSMLLCFDMLQDD
jgi:hypothetical protein